MSASLIDRSSGESVLRDEEWLHSISQGRRASSSMMSKPRSSKQLVGVAGEEQTKRSEGMERKGK